MEKSKSQSICFVKAWRAAEQGRHSKSSVPSTANDHSQVWGFGVYVMFMSLFDFLAFRILINIRLCLPVEIKKCVCVCPHISLFSLAPAFLPSMLV